MIVAALKKSAVVSLTAAILPLAGAEKILNWSFDRPDALPDTPGAVWIGKRRGERVTDRNSGNVLRVGTDKSGKKILSAAVKLPVKSGVDSGCVSFRVKPEDWNGDQQDFRNFIDLSNDAGEKLSIYRLHNYSKGVFIVTLMGKDGKRADAGFDMSNWKQGQWYHLAVCWDTRYIRIYQNGKLMRSSPVKGFRFSKPFSMLETGRFIKTYSGGYMQMDDIMLFDAPVSREEAENMTQVPSRNVLINGRTKITIDPKDGSISLQIPESGRIIASSGRLTKMRVREAEALLRDTVLPIEEVALRSGFGDRSHFSVILARFRRTAQAEAAVYRNRVLNSVETTDKIS